MNLLLTSNGDIDVTGGAISTVSGQDEIAQLIRIAVLSFRGDDYYDTRIGVPWQDLMEKGVTAARIRDEVRRAIEGVPGVVEVARIEVARVDDTRVYTLDFAARTIEGDVAFSLELPT